MTGPLFLSLDGEWDFFYSPQLFTPAESPLPEKTLFTGKMVTPGYWDDHYELFDEEDFFGLTARFNPDYRKVHFPMGRSLTPHASSSFLIGTGFYRKTFVAEKDFKCAVLTVGPAMWGCNLYCNGHFAGATANYSTASRFEIEDFLIPGKENELILIVGNLHDDGGAYHRLDKSHDGIAFGARPGQHRGLAAQGYQSERGGIGGGVSIKYTSGTELADYFISFAGKYPLWHIETRGGKAVLEWKMSYNGTVIDSGNLEIEETAEFTSAVPPVLWSNRTPQLCDIELVLRNGEKVSDRAAFRWGARKTERDGMQFKLNGTPTFFRGLTEHCYFPETTNPHFDKEKYLRDLGKLREAGFNFIRCHTWCPPEPFFDACDELGYLVQVELPSVWNFDEAESVLRLLRRHTSPVILCEGNEKVIDETAILRLQQLADLMRNMAPGMLFNPQEAMRGIEYEFTPGRKITTEPFSYDAERLDRVKAFSDCFGALAGEFSYQHDTFCGREPVEKRLAVYDRPCLLHESGILGGYLDFSLEKRYEGTFIGTDLFKAAREHMQKHGVYENARLYYEKNTLFISACRKQLVENIRSLRNAAGFDYLGGIDTHWHLIGYPCGILNEFYEEKSGESIADVRRYCGESILICSASNRRNRLAGSQFCETVEFVCYEAEEVANAEFLWRFEDVDGHTVVSGRKTCGQMSPGCIIPLEKISFVLPESSAGTEYTLKAQLNANGKVWNNFWSFWVFPEKKTICSPQVKTAAALTPELVEFITGGGRVLLTGNFPGEMMREVFRSHTSGRSIGHSGALMHPHPLWEKFPQNGYLNWQFLPLMENSFSLVYDRNMPEFSPVFSLIPSFKMVKHKSMLSEFSVGKGHLMICGFNLEADDPACRYMKYALTAYLDGENFAASPIWEPADLLKKINTATFSRTGKKIDEGGRPID